MDILWIMAAITAALGLGVFLWRAANNPSRATASANGGDGGASFLWTGPASSTAGCDASGDGGGGCSD